MERYGFFGGSFNPPTKAHIELALEIVNKFKLDRLIFVPVSNKYPKEGLIEEKHRYNMLMIATKKYKQLEVSTLELNIDKNLTMQEVFDLINRQYLNKEIYYIMGADNVNKIKDNLLNYNYIIIEREGYEIEKTHKNANFKIMTNKEYSNISSTNIRQNIRENKTNNIKENIDKEVLKYILENKLYKKI